MKKIEISEIVLEDIIENTKAIFYQLESRSITSSEHEDALFEDNNYSNEYDFEEFREPDEDEIAFDEYMELQDRITEIQNHIKEINNIILSLKADKNKLLNYQMNFYKTRFYYEVTNKNKPQLTTFLRYKTCEFLLSYNISNEPLLHLKLTSDLAVYCFLLGELGLGPSIELNGSNVSEEQYNSQIEIFNEKYTPRKKFKLESVRANATAIYINRNDNTCIRHFRRAFIQLLQEFPNEKVKIKKYASDNFPKIDLNYY